MMGKCRSCGRTRNLNTKGICTDCNVSGIKKRVREAEDGWRRELLMLAGKVAKKSASV
jgi:NMD protein affecting ribosome stability and mRNA decay